MKKPFQSKRLHLPWKKTEVLHHPLQTSLLIQSICRKVLSSDHTEEKCKNFVIFKFVRRLFKMHKYVKRIFKDWHNWNTESWSKLNNNTYTSCRACVRDLDLLVHSAL